MQVVTESYTKLFEGIPEQYNLRARAPSSATAPPSRTLVLARKFNASTTPALRRNPRLPVLAQEALDEHRNGAPQLVGQGRT
jgi:hypothetical protein